MPKILRAFAVLTALLAVAAVAAAPASGQAPYPAKQEQVRDFGRLVPEHEVIDVPSDGVVLERVTTAVPWGRGMAIIDRELIVLSRGRHRGEGGVDQDFYIGYRTSSMTRAGTCT